FERIAREHNCFEKFQSVPDDLKDIIESCLNIYPKNRPTCEDLLRKDIFQNFQSERPFNRSKVCDPFEIFTINELYHWWQLAGGDIFQELKKQGLIRSSPPILSLPNLVTIEGATLGQERNPATLYDPRIVQMPLDALYQRLAHIPLNCYYPLIHSTSKIIASSMPPPYDATGLPLVIREKDSEYQFHRGYPHTKDLILKEASKDIPPLLRGEIWAALLDIKGDYERQYLKIDKETSTTTDRQIEVDIPRCHQYNELLSSTEDNSMIIQEYLAKFSQLIAFHDPHLANHLHDINFYPELFAIPWFLTVFSHVFPLYKILHLWDKLLLGDSSFPLHIGLSVLTQLRDRLLTSGFNECILLFSDLPEVDIEKCVSYSTATFQLTPKSITSREHQNEKYHPKSELDISGVTLQELNRERCPRISVADFVDLVRNQSDSILVIDIRNPMQCAVINSINIPFSSVTFGETSIESIGQYSTTISNSRDKIIAVIGTEDTDLELFPKFLLKCGISKVCVLHGGFNLLLPITPAILISHNQI
ncbi:TBC domain-containing protein kinase-like protein, partial [Asbolus verrucosus]